MSYLWYKGREKHSFPSLTGNKKTDVLIIGGGMAGILLASSLEDAGVDYLLVDENEIGSGITKGTTAVITAQHDTLYKDLIQSIGAEKAKMYLDSNLQAVEKYKKICKNIDCDFEIKKSLIYSTDDRKIIEDEIKALKSLNYSAGFTDSINLPFYIKGAVYFPEMAQFNPLKFIGAISKNLKIYEHTRVIKTKGDTAYADNGQINAKHIVVASHFPFVNSHGFFYMKMYQKRSYVIAYENCPDIDCTAMDIKDGGIYLRNYKNLLLIGGSDHKTGYNGGYDEIRSFASKYFPEAKEKYAWSNQDCVTLDSVPYIGKYGSANNLYVITGFNLWGMTSSLIAGEIIRDLILNKENEYASLFAPDRNIMKKQLFINIGEAVKGYITPTAHRCSHLGCALKFNAAENTWDCPCHGSRFTQDGKKIDNPSMRDINV